MHSGMDPMITIQSGFSALFQQITTEDCDKKAYECRPGFAP